MKFTRLAVSLMAFGLPFSTFAALLTPQQLLDRSYASWNIERPTASTYQFEIKTSSSYLRTPTYRSPEIELKLNMSSENFPRPNHLSDGTIRLRLPYLKFTQGNQVYELREAITLEARVVGMDLYFRVASLSDQIFGFISSLDPDTREKIQGLVGQWIRVSLDDLTRESGLPDLSRLKLEDLQGKNAYLALMRELQAAKVIRVTGVEKRYRGPDSHQMVRVRAAFNPKAVDIFLRWSEREGLTSSLSVIAPSELRLTSAEKAKVVRELKRVLSQVKLAAVLDETDGSLDRVEMGINYSQPTYTYKWVKNKSIKLREGTSHLKMNVGVELRPMADRVVEAPADSISLDDLTARLNTRPAVTEPPLNGSIPYGNDILTPESSSIYPQTITERDHVTGNPQGRVTMVVYSDFECPFCERHEASLKQTLREFPQDVRVVYRHYPLSFHPFALPAAEAAECAGQVGGSLAYWTMHEAIFAQNPSGFGADTWMTLARRQGLNETAFQACMTNHDTLPKIHQDMEAGNSSLVRGTPATFINGKLVSGAVPYETLRSELVSAGAQQ